MTIFLLQLIRAFVKTPFYRVLSSIALEGENFEGEWRAVEGSRYFQTPYLYKENGFKEKAYAEKLIQELSVSQPLQCTVEKIERKKENRNPPLLFNLAELQNVCSKLFKISPDETLRITQELHSTLLNREITKIWQRPDMLMISRSQTIMQSYPQARA